MLTRQKQVMDGTDELAGCYMRRAAQSYQRKIATPMRAAIGKVKETGDNPKDLKRLLRALGPATLKRMDASGLAKEIGPMRDQCEAIGTVSATPQKQQSRDRKGADER